LLRILCHFAVMKAQLGSRVRVQGLQSKPKLNGEAGTVESWDGDMDAWEVQLDSGTLAVVKPENLELCDLPVQTATRVDDDWHSGVLSSTADWAVAMFGQDLKTPDGMRPTRQVLNGKRAVLVYFCDEWCERVSALTDGYLNQEGSDVEVVFVLSDHHVSPAAFQEFCADMPWVVFHGDEVALDKVMKRFNITVVPCVRVLRGTDGSVVCLNARTDIESREDFGTLLARWRL